MSDNIELTPAQQRLMAFLDQLPTTPLTPEALALGNELLDDAASECRQLQQEIAQQQQQQGGQKR